VNGRRCGLRIAEMKRLPPRDMIRLATVRYLNDRAQSIFGGSSEIQHDIMARTLFQEQR